jgi:hypothetical protein
MFATENSSVFIVGDITDHCVFDSTLVAISEAMQRS